MLKCYFHGVFFLYDKNNFHLEALLFVIFSFSKVFEGIATVWRENFKSLEEEKSFYDLAYDSIELQKEVLDYLIYKQNNIRIGQLDWIIQLYLSEGKPESKK